MCTDNNSACTNVVLLHSNSHRAGFRHTASSTLLSFKEIDSSGSSSQWKSARSAVGRAFAWQISTSAHDGGREEAGGKRFYLPGHTGHQLECLCVADDMAFERLHLRDVGPAFDAQAEPLLTNTSLNTVVQHTKLDQIALSASIIVGLVRLVLLSNIYFALRPVLPYVSKPDPIEDIPLTPSQRALLGLPRSQSNTPSSQAGEVPANYITPPRYRRSSPSPFAGTPQSNGTGNRSISAHYSASPMSTSRFAIGFSPTPQQPSGTPSRRLSGSPFSPSSPLFNKRFLSPVARHEVMPNADFSESTRSLLDGATSVNSFQSSLKRSQSMRERGRPQAHEPGTPSPSAREKSKVNIQPGLNYKWLYEKGMKVGKNGTIEY